MPDTGPARPPGATTGRTRRRTGRILGISGALLLLVLGGVYLVAYLQGGDTLARDAEVAGVPVGGMTVEEATAALEEDLLPQLEQPIAVRTGAGAEETADGDDDGPADDAGATEEPTEDATAAGTEQISATTEPTGDATDGATDDPTDEPTGDATEETAPLDEQIVGDAGSYTVEPAAVGLTVDVPATLAQIPGGSANPADLAQALFGGEAVDPVLSVNRSTLTEAVTAIASRSDSEAVEGSISFAEDASVVVEEPTTGRTLQVQESVNAVEEQFRARALDPGAEQEPITLPEDEVPPQVGAEEIQTAVADLADPAVSGPITISAGEDSTQIQPAQLVPALSMTVEEGGYALQLDGETLVESASDQLAELGQQGESATIVLAGGRPEVRPSTTGARVDPGDFAEAVESVLTAREEDRRATIELEDAEPDLTTEEAEALGVDEVVSEFTTEFPYAEYRNVNIGRAAELINGTLLLPDEVFSLNGIVGERTEANGFTAGTIIDGGRFREALGGGVSQVATTTYNAGFFAGLADVEHRPHSLYIDRYPIGREATVAWPTLDMAFENDSEYGVLVQTLFEPSSQGSNGSLTVRIWSTQHRDVSTTTGERRNIVDFDTVTDDSEGCVDQGGAVGFDITVTRQIREGGEVVADESYDTTYNPAAAITCR